jgi:hypothetical protein
MQRSTACHHPGLQDPALTQTETLERARHALESHAWQQAHEAFVSLHTRT